MKPKLLKKIFVLSIKETLICIEMEICDIITLTNKQLIDLEKKGFYKKT
jgi:hypothetical protein